jgi:hypothetical protein
LLEAHLVRLRGAELVRRLAEDAAERADDRRPRALRIDRDVADRRDRASR